MDASRMLGLVYAAQLERQRQILIRVMTVRTTPATPPASGWRWFRSMRTCTEGADGAGRPDGTAVRG